MWILPKQLHTSDFVPDTEGLNLDSNESSQICAQSLFVRSKPTPARTWLLKWKRDSWSQHLFGRILKPSLGNHFVTEWTSSLEVTPANPSAQQEKGLEQKTQDIFGLSSQAEFGFFDPSSASLKTSKDISALDSERSLESWNQWVTKCRGEYSLRVKSAHRTNANECSSWPTIRASEYKDTGPIGSKSHDHMLGKGYLCAVVTQDAANWPTIQARDYRSVTGNEMSQRDNAMQNLNVAVTMHGLPAPAKPSMDGSRQESWRTPSSSDGEGGIMEMREGCAGKYKLRDHVAAEEKRSWATPQQRDFKDAEPLSKWTERAEEQKAKGVNLHLALPSQVMHTEEKSWATPQSRDAKGAEGRMIRDGQSTDLPSQTEVAPTGQWNRANGKLNPRWVETLMGLPIGWTMPSCASPVTIVPTNCDSSATESFLQQQREPLEF
jgi:hypothetical protein